ncbi:FAD-binding oxidoreductase [Temperatibacter marinus]|uniref:D-lactate dehydrogenase (cytochrome) n=1 Tax=Temperatibacter marinus TaxID=1456591 RepID=A0AA52EJ75_9PROT|nr:FAD-binding oxidoreductase [Temperatibacter marinus]WND03499.1 FAD-binding oxidoreductase [Temperatibacter marinus]
MSLPASLLKDLTALVGDDCVIVDEAERAYFSQDVSGISDSLTGAIVQPNTKEELAQVVKLAVEAGVAILPRGGGMSYTNGYCPQSSKSLSIDTQRLNRIIEVNSEDMYVTVEAGCTWKSLYEDLLEKGLRTPYWGTLSGIYATVGGSVSQNSIFFGSGQFGTAADSVLAFEIVLADGSIMKTGAAAVKGGSPFMRHYGPDLTGLFTSDAGALGVKATITLRLIRQPKYDAHCSYNFPTVDSMFEAASSVARAGLASESFGFDPVLHGQRMKRESMSRDLKSLGNVMKKSGSVFSAMKEGIKIAFAGRRYMEDVIYAYNFSTESHSQQGAKDAIHAIEKIAENAGGLAVENSIPQIVRANPFVPLNNMVGPQGERWLPVHGLVPHSKAIDCVHELNKAFSSHEKAIKEHGIEIGYLFATVSSNISVVELVFFWPDKLEEIQKRTVEKSVLKRFTDFGDRPDARALVQELKNHALKIYQEMGSTHLQIGRTYPYHQSLDPATFALVKNLKKSLDPKGLINPGVLGL